MIWARLALLSTLLWASISNAQTGSADTRTLCFFSLNNSREFELTRSFLDAASRLGGNPVNTVELHDPATDANPQTSFQHMLENNPGCDGLVISGHHTGSFGGNRAKGVLGIGFLEQLSCSPQYEDFFRGVKGLWLQGCRTLGVGPLDAELDNTTELQADYHTQRVGAELSLDGLEQGFADLSFEFSATLDQDNPLASRYLRIFPAANVFGWTRSSPGIKAQSEKSLLYHMAHMSKIADAIPAFDPLRANSAEQKKDMSRYLWQVLAGNPAYSPVARDAWLSHGQVKTPGLGFDNPDLDTYSPLLTSPDSGLLTARAMGCGVRNAQNFAELQQALNSILLSQDHLAYNLNIIWESFQQYAQDNPAEYAALRKQLVASAPLMNQLSAKLQSPQTGLLTKIEYYSFYKELTGNSSQKIETLILEHVRYFLLAQDLAGNRYDIRDFREALLLSADSHQLASTSFYVDLLNAPGLQNSALYALAWSFLKQPPQDSGRIIDAVIKHPKTQSDTLRAAAIWLMTHADSAQAGTLASIVAHPQVDAATLETVATSLSQQKFMLSDELVQAIVAHPATGSLTLRQLALAVSKNHATLGTGVLEDMLSHPSIDSWGIQNVARATAKNQALESPEFLWQIINHEKADANTLSSVAITLGKTPIEGAPELLDSIRNHPQADARTLRYADRALASNSAPAAEHTIF